MENSALFGSGKKGGGLFDDDDETADTAAEPKEEVQPVVTRERSGNPWVIVLTVQCKLQSLGTYYPE